MDSIPFGVIDHPLTPHSDTRGTLTEIYREIWGLGCRPIQLNVVSSAAGVLRGVHVHVRHADHIVLIMGRMLIGLHDLRHSSPTAGGSCMLEIDAKMPRAVVIPVGVAHGFYFPEPSTHVYGVSEYWNPADELACRWDARELGLAWPTRAPKLSERDATARDYPQFLDDFRECWAAVHDHSPAGGGR